MQDGRIKVRSVWPDQRMDFAVEPDTIEHLWILQWTIQIASQDGMEINRPLAFIVKRDFQGIGPRFFERTNFINGVFQGSLLIAKA